MAGPCWSSTWSPGERTRSACTSTRSVTRWRATRVRVRDVPPGPRRTRPAVPPRLAARAASPTDGHLIAPPRRSCRSSKGCSRDAGGGGTPMTVRPPDRDGRNLDPYAGHRRLGGPGAAGLHDRGGAGGDPGRHLGTVRRRQGHDHRCHAPSRGRGRPQRRLPLRHHGDDPSTAQRRGRRGDYHFVSREDFLRLRAARGFLEANEVHGNWYGSPRQPVRDALASGRDAILVIESRAPRS